MPYHHGDLLAALTATAVQLARDGGPDAVVLREAARRVGVSPTAAYRHVADREGLLELVAADAGRRLVLRMRRAQRAVSETDVTVAALQRFRAVGAAYVGFALREPGLFRAALAAPSAGANPLLEAGPAQVLAEALDELVALGLLAATEREHADAVAWAAVHGLAVLLIDGRLPAADVRSARADKPDGILDRMLNAIAFGLLPR